MLHGLNDLFCYIRYPETTFILTLLFIMFACEDRIWDNPYDEKGDKSLWAPSNLQIEQLSLTHLRLTWRDNAEGEEGFIFDKKIEGEDWIIEYAVLKEDSEEWIDSCAVPLTVNVYRPYAYAGDNISTLNEWSTIPSFPRPTEFFLELLSLSEIRLTWRDNSDGEDGFKIDREVIGEEWEQEYAIVGENVEEWTDTEVPPLSAVHYNVYAYVNQVNSVILRNSLDPSPTNLELTQISVGEIELTWEDNSIGEEGFKVDRKVGEGDWEIGYAVLAPDVENWVDNDIEPGQTYFYRVYAFVSGYTSASIEGSISTG